MRYDLSSDEEIVKAILYGGEEREAALERLYGDEGCKKKVSLFVRSNKGNNADGKDLFHDGLIIADRNIRMLKFRGESSLHHYIYSVCKYLWLNKLKKKRRISYSDKEEKLDMPVLIDPESIYLDNELKGNISDALDLLGVKCKNVLELWKLNYSMKEIAEILDIKSEGMARKTKHQCYQKLLKLIEENPELRKNLKKD
jgi:RNA polymerase sigma factor (sigma-70 family)